MKKLNKICVLFNNPGTSSTDNISEADEDTKISAQGVCDTLKTAGYEVTTLGIGPLEIEQIKVIDADLIFNLVEWSGRETHLGVKVIKTMEEIGLPFTGSGSLGYQLSSDKTLMKKKFAEYDIPTPKWKIVNDEGELSNFDLTFPVIAKPSMEHCGIGLSQDSVVIHESGLRDLVIKLIKEYQQPVLVEEFIEGSELQTTILEKGGLPWVLPPAEITFVQKPGHASILTYDAKWRSKSSEYKMSNIAVVDLAAEMKKRIEKVCIDCYLKLDGRDYPRVDMRVRENEVFVLEINNNPGMGFDTESEIGLSARAVGFDYKGLLTHIVENAYARYAA